MQEASWRIYTTLHLFLLCHVIEKTYFGGVKVRCSLVLDLVSCFPANPQPKQMGRAANDLLMKGLHAQQSASLLLTPTATVSSPWNLGRNRSPRKISAWLRGRKRHNTLMLHSDVISPMAQIVGGGGRMLLSAGRRDAAEAGGDQMLVGAWSDRPDKRRERCDDASSFSVQRTVRVVERLCCFILTSWERLRFIYAQLDGVSVSQWGGLAKIDVKSQNDPLHY